jgi:hypothetical protein
VLHALAIGPNILFSTLFLNTFNLCSSFSVRDEFSHPYKTTGKIVVLHILILVFREETRMKETLSRIVASIP